MTLAKDKDGRLKRIEYREKNLRASRTGGVAARAQGKHAGVNVTINSSKGVRVSRSVAKNTQVALQGGRFQLRGRYGKGATKLNLSKTGASVSTKSKYGTFNWTKPQYSSFKLGGVQVRGKKAAEMQAFSFILEAAAKGLYWVLYWVFKLTAFTVSFLFGKIMTLYKNSTHSEHITLPKKIITLPLSQKKVEIRPFLGEAGERLVMAHESASEEKDGEHNNKMQKIIDACTNGQIKYEEMSQPDIEYIFIHIRIFGGRETSRFQYKCLKDIDDGNGGARKCGTLMPATVDLKKIELKRDDEHNNLFQIPNNNVYIKMEYPSIALSTKLEKERLLPINTDMTWEQVEYLIVLCIESIIEGNEQDAKSHSDFTRDELTEWLKTVPSAVLIEIVEEFFMKLPCLEYNIEMVCPSCGAEHTVPIRGLENFFD